MTLPTSDPQDTVTVVLPEENKKVCADCKHLIGVRESKYEIDKWRCGHPNNVWESSDPGGWEDDLVTGLRHRRFKISTDIYVLRISDQYCHGNWWEKYDKPIYYSEPTIGGKKAAEITPTEEVFSATDLQANKDAAARRLEELRRKKLGL